MIPYFNRLRDEMEAELAETQIVSIHDELCRHVLNETPADVYEFTLENTPIVEKYIDHVLNKIRERFFDEDVLTTFEYDVPLKQLKVKIESLPLPTSESTTVKYYWSRAPGKFVNKLTGDPVSLSSSLSIGPAFTGTVREWYETLVETIIDVSNEMHKRTGVKPAKIRVSADVCTLLECSVLYRPSLSNTSVYAGTLSNRFKVLVNQPSENEKLLGIERNIVCVYADSGTTRHVGFVEILDMDII